MRVGHFGPGHSDWSDGMVLREKISAEQREEGTAEPVIKKVIRNKECEIGGRRSHGGR